METNTALFYAAGLQPGTRARIIEWMRRDWLRKALVEFDIYLRFAPHNSKARFPRPGEELIGAVICLPAPVAQVELLTRDGFKIHYWKHEAPGNRHNGKWEVGYACKDLDEDGFLREAMVDLRVVLMPGDPHITAFTIHDEVADV
jgi:hypothetical protein